MKRDHKVAWALVAFLAICALVCTSGCLTKADAFAPVEPVLIRAKALADVHATEVETLGTTWSEGYTLSAEDVATIQGYGRDARTVYQVLQELHKAFKEE